MASRGKDRQLGPLTAPSRERAMDLLRCERGLEHDVRMESVPVQGIYIGRLVAWCHTCRRVIKPNAAPPPATADDMRARRQTARLTQAMRRQDAQARREFILNALARGSRQVDVARRLGITEQRVSQIINGRTRKTA